MFASPADAHGAPHYIWHGSDQGQIRNYHHAVFIHDGECDGNYVSIEYYMHTFGGGVDRRSLTDPSGCGTHGAHLELGSLTIVTAARVCEERVGCTAWHHY